MRTTIDIDDPILADLRKRQKREGKPLGRLVSDLLAQALSASQATAATKQEFKWISSPAEPLIDYADRDALWDALDEPRR